MLSLVFDRRRTYEGLQRGLKMFFNLLPPLLTVLILVSVFIYLVPEETIMAVLGSRAGIGGVFIAALVGSISLIPGFIAFPLARILIDSHISYTVVAVFITTLMMVGVLTLPLEIKYFGRKAALMRNILSFFGAIVIGILIGVFM